MKYIFGVLGVAVLVLLAVVLFNQQKDDTPLHGDMDESRVIAEAWVMESAPTYVFDGFNLSLENEEAITARGGVEYEFTFLFDSRASGYGNREEEMSAQVITPHTIVVVVRAGEVVSAITDGVFNELTGEMLPESKTTRVSVYFLSLEDTEVVVVPVEKEIPFTDAPARASLELLLAGLSEEESASGLSTAIPKGVVVQSITIVDGVAFADFSSALNEGVAGSMTVLAIREQIESTLLQFSSVSEVVISVDGETEEILQP